MCDYSVGSGNHSFLDAIGHVKLSQSFCSSSIKMPDLCRKECNLGASFRAECSVIFYSLHIDQLGVSMYIAMYCKGQLL